MGHKYRLGFSMNWFSKILIFHKYKSWAFYQNNFPFFRIEIIKLSMLSQQDIFLPITQRDLLLLNPQQSPLLNSVFELTGVSVHLLLTDSLIILTEVLFDLLRIFLRKLCTVVNLISLSSSKSSELNGRYFCVYFRMKRHLGNPWASVLKSKILSTKSNSLLQPPKL